MIGLAFSRLNSAQNIGYIIPSEEIDLFLQDIADGHYDGKPAMYDNCRLWRTPLCARFSNSPDTSRAWWCTNRTRTDAAYPLKEWDVITKIGDTPVDDQGMIKLGDNLRVRFEYEVQHIATNGTVPLTIVRAGKELKVACPSRRIIRN